MYLVNPGDSKKLKYQIISEYGPKYLGVIELMQDKYKKSLVREGPILSGNCNV